MAHTAISGFPGEKRTPRFPVRSARGPVGKVELLFGGYKKPYAAEMARATGGEGVPPTPTEEGARLAFAR